MTSIDLVCREESRICLPTRDLLLVSNPYAVSHTCTGVFGGSEKLEVRFTSSIHGQPVTGNGSGRVNLLLHNSLRLKASLSNCIVTRAG